MVLSCLGFQCDYLTGEKCVATIKLNGKLRDMNREFNVDNIPFLPEELYQLRKAKKLSGMKDGDGYIVFQDRYNIIKKFCNYNVAEMYVNQKFYHPQIITIDFKKKADY